MPAQYEGPVWLLVEYKGNKNMAEKKFQNLKPHDYHVIMTQLLPVALRGLLSENVRLTIVKLCSFLNAISQKVIDTKNPTKAKELCGAMSCQFRAGVPTILLQYHDTRPSSSSRRDCHSGTCISTQYVPL